MLTVGERSVSLHPWIRTMNFVTQRFDNVFIAIHPANMRERPLNEHEEVFQTNPYYTTAIESFTKLHGNYYLTRKLQLLTRLINQFHVEYFSEYLFSLFSLELIKT